MKKCIVPNCNTRATKIIQLRKHFQNSKSTKQYLCNDHVEPMLIQVAKSLCEVVVVEE